MLFNSLDFIVFAFIFFAFYPFLKKAHNVRHLYVILASFVFYGWWDARYLILIVFSGLIDFFAGYFIKARPNHKKLFLVSSLVGNLGCLALFKYSGFLISSLNALLANMGVSPLEYAPPSFFLEVPVGISFYTFQSMSYTLDVYRGRLEPTKNPLLFFSYLSMFPQLVAGPIVRASDLLPQLAVSPQTTEQDRWEGTKLILVGYFKKTVIADNLGYFVNTVFSAHTQFDSTVHWWLAMIFFAVQIYCDFSGYSDIARGLGRWMGLDFPLNFRFPYISKSFREFWQRWHISLSTWFRDYLYISLGGNRKGAMRTHVNMWITMLLCGLWHGAGWTFVLWGALHALYMTVERLTRIPERLAKLPFGNIAGVALTFILCVIAWVFFRAADLSQALYVLDHMFSLQGRPDPAVVVVGLSYFSLFILVELASKRFLADYNGGKPDLRGKGVAWQLAAWTLVGLCAFYLRGPYEQFIYFQF